MFIKIILSYLLGYLRISVEGYYIERFINICKIKKITVWNLKRSKEIQLSLNVRVSEFKELCQIAKKARCKIKIEHKKGLPFLLHKYKKRKIFLILLIIVSILIGLSSNFVWNVDIVEENAQEMENIAQDIENAGLKTGTLKSKINTKEIINRIRLQRKDVAWMGIELKGTNAIVKLVKADEKPDIIDENEYCSILSDKEGVITKINAQNGTANVKVGDTVKKGDILINGWMEGKFTGIRYVHSKGEVEAKVWYTKSKKIFYNTTQIQETGNVKNTYAIKINNFEINFLKKLSKFEIYDTIETEKKFKLFSDFYLPISIVKTTYKEQEKIQKQYELEEAKNIGIEELQKELEEEIKNKDKIVNKNINTYEQADGVEIYVTYEVIENIGTNEKIVF
ncbi:MAG: sporulation protein YqfD [Clostridia bacterium]|nr:sporulation protein YqfD [Clostridia bacterium]